MITQALSSVGTLLSSGSSTLFGAVGSSDLWDSINESLLSVLGDVFMSAIGV